MYDIALSDFPYLLKSSKGSNYYDRIDNKKLYLEIKKFKTTFTGKRLIVPHYIHYCFWIMANKYSRIKSFINYTFRDDMVSEAVITCIKYLTTFNCKKSKNPYSYFNQAIHNSFLQFIAKEKKQSAIKDDLLRMEKERREGFGRKKGEKKKDYEDKVWS